MARSDGATLVIFGMPNRTRRRLILLERHDAYRYVLARALRDRALNVVDVPTAGDAAAYLERDPNVEWAVIDIRATANARTGLRFALMMRRRNRDSRIILMSDHPAHRRVPEALPFGEILLKTSDVSAMAKRIQEGLTQPADDPAS